MARKRPPLLESPRLALGLAALSAAGFGLAAGLGRLPGWLAALLHMVLVSLITYGLFAWDKRRAIRGDRRIAESNLLLASWLGGAAGGWWAMRSLRHKTKQPRFRLLVPLALVLQLALVGWLGARALGWRPG